MLILCISLSKNRFTEMLENYNIPFPTLVTPIQADYNHGAIVKSNEERSMPVYTYRCENCGIQFDHQQSFNAANLTVCPECEEETLHRVYRPVGIVFKGSGFYATDNRSPSGQTEERTHHKEDATSSESKKSETKPAEKTEKPAKTESKKSTE